MLHLCLPLLSGNPPINPFTIFRLGPPPPKLLLGDASPPTLARGNGRNVRVTRTLHLRRGSAARLRARTVSGLDRAEKDRRASHLLSPSLIASKMPTSLGCHHNPLEHRDG